jgi:hypothetical protein
MRTDTPSTETENRSEPTPAPTPEVTSEPTPAQQTASQPAASQPAPTPTPTVASAPTPAQPDSPPDSILMAPGAVAAVAPAAPARHRPFTVTILAIFAGLLAVLSVVHLLQALAIIPYVIGRLEIRAFSFFSAVMWGLMVWIWAWLVQMLWKVDPQAWIFLVVVAMFNLIFDFTLMLLGETTWSDVAPSFLLNGLILLYCMLPGTRRAFERD